MYALLDDTKLEPFGGNIEAVAAAGELGVGARASLFASARTCAKVFFTVVFGERGVGVAVIALAIAGEFGMGVVAVVVVVGAAVDVVGSVFAASVLP